MRHVLGLAVVALAIAVPAHATDWDVPAAPNRPTMEALHADIEACRSQGCRVDGGLTSGGLASHDVERLAWWVARGNRLAIRLSFAAADIVDSDGARTLAQSYGNIIKQDPAAFLAMARDEGAPTPLVAADAAAIPDTIADDLAAQARELKARRKALQGVTDRSLSALRDQCVAGITARIAEMAPNPGGVL